MDSQPDAHFPIALSIPGASDAELHRGKVAAMKVLETAGVSVSDAVFGMDAVEWWDICHFVDEEKPSEAEQAAAEAWQEAHIAAWEAACSDWPDDRKNAAIATIRLPVLETS